MQRISSEMMQITEDNQESTALSTHSEGLTKRTQIRKRLVTLSLARREGLSDADLLLYSKALEEFPDAAIGAVIDRMITTPRAEYEPKIPELADLREMVRLQDRRDNAWVPCGNCGEAGLVIVEEGGGRVAKRCECYVAWKQQRDRAQPPRDSRRERSAR